MIRMPHAILLLFILHAPAALFASDPMDARPTEWVEIARKNSAREELLLFFDEKDLAAATKRKTPLKKAPAIATVVTADEIRNMGARSIEDVLKMTTGFGLSVDELGRLLVEVRGIRTTLSEKVLVMIDGHRLNEPYSGSAFANVYNDLSVENIKQVEIIRGPGSALYGANAFVAVINVVTKDADDIDGVVVQAGGGSFNTKKIDMLGGGAANGFQITGSIDYLKTDGAGLFVEKDYFKGMALSSAPGNTDMSVDKKEIFVKASYGGLSFRGQYVDKQRGGYIGYAYALTDENVLTYDNFWGDLGYRRELADSVELQTRLYVDQFYLNSKLELLPEGSFGSIEGGSARTHLIDRTIGAELQMEHVLFRGNLLIYGALFEMVRQFEVNAHSNFDFSVYPPRYLGSYQDISSWNNFNKNAERDVFALFVQDEWAPVNNLNITAGVRYDDYSDFGETLNPRFGMVWGFCEDCEMKLLYGAAFRAPNFKEMYDQNNFFVIGNPDLKPEKVSTYEAGLGYKLMKRIKFSVDYFYSVIDDIIDRDPAPKPPVWANKGKAKVDGVELEMMGQYDHSSYWRISYTHQNPVNDDTGERLPYVPAQRATAGINYAVSRYLNAHVDALWTGERPRTASDPRQAMPPYLNVDAALTAKGFYRTLEIRGMVHNLFDRRYRDPDTSGPLQYIQYDFPREGMSVLADVTYRF